MIFPLPLPPTPPAGGTTIPDNIPGAGNCATVSTLPLLDPMSVCSDFQGYPDLK